MLLLLIRHAQAAEQDEALYPDDTERPLVTKGKRVQRRMSKELCERKLVPDRIFSSPWRRAWQTARILVQETELPKSARIACEALAAPPTLETLAAEIGALKPEETIALVGHEPWMSELASLLLTGSSDGVKLDFPKSGALGIERDGLAPDAGPGVLQFFLVP